MLRQGRHQGLHKNIATDTWYHFLPINPISSWPLYYFLETFIMNPRADGELPHVSSLALHHAPFLTTMLGFVEGGGRYSKPWCHLSRYCLVFLPLLSRMAACQDTTVIIISMNRNIHLLDFLREINLCIAIEILLQYNPWMPYPSDHSSLQSTKWFDASHHQTRNKSKLVV